MTERTVTYPFVLSLFLVFAAEMGDKTQLVALAFATRYDTRTVLVGVFAATLLVHLFSVGFGELLGWTVPLFWVQTLAGLAFIGFGLWTLRGDKLDDAQLLTERRRSPVMTVAVTFFLAELGDKTMLMTVTIAGQQHSFVSVWLGSTLGMVVADGLAIIVGKVLGARLPETLIRYGAAAVFVITGAATLMAAATHL